MSAADYRNDIELPSKLTTEIESCRRLVRHPKADKGTMFEVGATAVFRVADKDDREVWQVAVDTLYEIAAGVGIADDPAQAILDIAYKKSFELPAETDPIIQAWEANDPRNKKQANGHDAAPTLEPNTYGTKPAHLPATIDRPTRELKLNDPADYAGKEIPPREWLALHRIPAGKPTLLSGDGGTGKTTIALQLLVSVAYGDEWLGARIDKQGPAWFISAEEDNDEIIRRLTAILDHQGRTLEDLKGRGVRWTCLDDENEYGDSDALLGVVDRAGRVQKTPLYEALLKLATEQRPAFIGIENAADVFAIDENNRSQVRQSVALLRRLAKRSGAAVMLNTHPSLYGLNSGGGTSGSTQWSNAVRSRLYFAAAKKGDDEETDIRELRVMKANYGPSGEAIRVCWHQGLFVPAGSAGSLERVSAEADIDQAYLDCLDTAAELQRTVVAWCEQIGMTRAELDFEAGLTDGHAGKLLAAGARKKLGLVTLGRVMAGAGLVLIVAVDPEFTPENRSHVRSHVQRQHWRRNRGPAWGRRMAALRTLKQSAAERSASARRAAQARWQRPQAVSPTPSSDAAE